MNNVFMQFKKQSVIQQRNLAFLFCGVLAVALILSLLVNIFSSRTTVIVPSRISGEYFISDSGGSNVTYLEDMAVSTAYNFLNISKANFEFSKGQILKITSPGRVKFIEALLLETHKIIVDRDISTVFRLEYMEVLPHQNKVKVYGELDSFIGSKRSNGELKGYLISFDYKGATLFLESFEEIKYLKNGEKVDEPN